MKSGRLAYLRKLNIDRSEAAGEPAGEFSELGTPRVRNIQRSRLGMQGGKVHGGKSKNNTKSPNSGRDKTTPRAERDELAPCV
jgi:hypothetical protein